MYNKYFMDGCKTQTSKNKYEYVLKQAIKVNTNPETHNEISNKPTKSQVDPIDCLYRYIITMYYNR